MTIRLVYVGASMAGKHTSLAWAVRVAGRAGLPRLTGRNEEYSLESKHLGISLVSAVISSARATHYYEEPTSPGLHPDVAREIGLIAAADAIVFVVDSQRARFPANKEQLKALRQDLSSRDIDLESKVVVFQINKRDLPDVVSIDELRQNLDIPEEVCLETVANQGIGVTEVISEVVRRIAAFCSERPEH